MDKLTEIGARVIAGNAVKALGTGWTNDIKNEDGLIIPVVSHESKLIGLHYIPGTGWVAAIGLRSALTEGEKRTVNNFLLKTYSDYNASPRRAVIECIDRSRRLLDALRPQLGSLDEVNRTVVKLESPEHPVPEMMTFDQWWRTLGQPEDLKFVAQLAWLASKEGK